MSAPQVVLDARITRQMSVGMIAYVRELVTRLPVVAPDLRYAVISNEQLPLADGMLGVTIDERMARNGSVGEQFALPSVMRRLRSGTSLTHLMSLYAPRFPPRPYVYTIHDLIHPRFPQYFKWKVRPYYSLVVGPTARRAVAVITGAQATIPDLQRFLGVRPEAVRVAPLGVSERFRVGELERMTPAASELARFDLAERYVLYAGNHREHKNIEVLAAAWQRAGQPADLVLTEDQPFTFDPDRYRKSGGRIVRAGHVSDAELVALYAGCAVAVQPSLYEGFGLGVLEGMAAGAPVIVAQTPALLEVAGDAALTFPPHDVDALAHLIDRALAGGADIDAFRARGRAKAASYSWDETARRTAAVYRETLGA